MNDYDQWLTDGRPLGSFERWREAQRSPPGKPLTAADPCPYYRDGRHGWVPNPDEQGPRGDQSDHCDACGVPR